MSNTARIAVPGSGDGGKWPIYNSTSNAWDLVPGQIRLVTGLVENDSAGAATNTAVIQQAMIDAHASTTFHTALTGAGSEGGAQKVILPAGRYYMNHGIGSASVYADACITQYNATILCGQGKGTQLILKAGQSTTAAPVSMIKPMEVTNWCGVEDLTLLGNRYNMTDTSGVSRGVDWTRGATAEIYDGMFWCRGVLAFQWGGAGFYAQGNANTGRFYDCMAYHNAQGFALKTDQALWGCVAGINDGEGFNVLNSSSCLISGCKGFGNSTDLMIQYSEQVIVDNFTSEDYRGPAGIWLLACRASRVTGGIYRSQSNATGNCALRVEDDGALDDNPWWSLNPHSLDIQLVCRFFDQPTAGVPLYYPKYLLTTRNLGAGVKINMRASGYSDALADFFPTCWTTARWNHVSGFRDCDVTFNNANGGFYQIPYPLVGTTITPDGDRGQTHIIGALTGNLIVAAPFAPYYGQRLTFLFTQDATGTRTVTFDATFKMTGGTFTAATGNGARSGMSFVYDGTDWVETSRGVAAVGGPPSGAAGGSLAGTYPNPTIAASVITNTEVSASAAIVLSKLATDPLARANHTGTQAASTIGSGTMATARLGSGTADGTTFLRGDQTWATGGGSGATNLDGLTDVAITSVAQGNMLARDGTQFVNRPADMFNIMDFGGNNGGSVDNATALAAVKTAAFAGAKPATIYFPPGTYVFSAGITAADGLRVHFAGRENTILSHTGNNTLFGNSAPGTRCFGWYFSGGCTIVGNTGASARAFDLADVSTSRFEDITIMSYTNGYAFKVHSAASGNAVYNIFLGCYALSNKYGWYIDGTSSNDQRLIGCRADSNNTAGVYLDTSNNLQLIGTAVESNAAGLVLRNTLTTLGFCDQCQITNSRFELNTGNAVDIGANVRYTTIVQPWFSGNGADIVDVGTSTHIVASARGQNPFRLQDGATLLGEITATGAGRFASLGVGNSASATSLGTLSKKMQVFDKAGTSLGYIPIYTTIT